MNLWNAQYAGQRAGTILREVTGRESIALTLNYIPYSAHRIIWKMIHNAEPPEVDHRNGDALDNRLDNLRAADRGGNSKNRRSQNPLGKGVTRRKTGFEATIAVNGKDYYLGRFPTAEDAHAAYCEAAKRLHGEFANFGEGPHRTSP